MRWGRLTAPRYWAVLALDVCVALLVFLLTLNVWSPSSSDSLLALFARVLPAWIVTVLLAAVVHHFSTESVIRFPNYSMIVRGMIPALVIGIVAVAMTLLTVALAAAPDLLSALAAWTRVLPSVFVPALLLALLVFVLRSSRSFLRGDCLGAQKYADSVEPPPLVVAELASIKPSIAITEQGATLASASVRVEVTRAPFGVVVKNAQGQTLWQLAERGLTRDLVLQKILSIPVLYTGNTIKMEWRAFGQPVTEVTDIKAEDDALVISLRSATVRLSFHTGDVLRLELDLLSSVLRHSSIAFMTPDDAHYLGFGQRFNKVDQCGEDIYFFVEEGGVGYEWTKTRLPWLYPILRWLYGPRGSFPNGEQCTGFPVPFGLVSRERGPTVGLFWNTYKPSWIKTASRGQGAGVNQRWPIA